MSVRIRVYLGAAAVCWAGAGFFRFALTGYGTLALLLLCAGAALALYGVLPRKGRAAVEVAVCLALAGFLAALVPVILASGGDDGGDAEYVIVLGAGVHGNTPSLSLLDRLRATKAYLDAHPDCAAILSGGQGEGESLTEAEAMYRWLTENGIAPSRLLREDRATNTRENLQYSFALFPSPSDARVAVLSSEYHLCRAKYLAGALGYSVSTIPARTSLPLLKWNYFAREAFGMAYHYLFGPRFS